MRHAGAGNLWLGGAGNFEANTVKNNRKDNLEIGLFYYNIKNGRLGLGVKSGVEHSIVYYS